MMISKYFARNWLNLTVCYSTFLESIHLFNVFVCRLFNHLTPNGHFSGRTAPLPYRYCIFYLFNRYRYWIF